MGYTRRNFYPPKQICNFATTNGREEMKTENYRGRRTGVFTGSLFLVLALAIAVLIPFGAQAQTAAGTSIGNQASATYTDSSSVSRTATSNIVTTRSEEHTSELQSH